MYVCICVVMLICMNFYYNSNSYLLPGRDYRKLKCLLQTLIPAALLNAVIIWSRWCYLPFWIPMSAFHLTMMIQQVAAASCSWDLLFFCDVCVSVVGGLRLFSYYLMLCRCFLIFWTEGIVCGFFLEVWWLPVVWVTRKQFQTAICKSFA